MTGLAAVTLVPGSTEAPVFVLKEPLSFWGGLLVAIPVAAGLLVPWGIDLPMALGAVAMSASTIIVAANAQLLRRLRLGPTEERPPGTAPTAAVRPAS